MSMNRILYEGGTSSPRGSNITIYDEPRRTVPRSQYRRPSEQYLTGIQNDRPEEQPWGRLAAAARGGSSGSSRGSSGGSRGGGGRRYGGGGGGGGMPGLSAEQAAAYRRLLDQGPNLYEYEAFDAPDYDPYEATPLPAYQAFEARDRPEYQAFTPSARDTSIYDDALGRVNAARAADYARAMGLFDDLDAQLASQYNVFNDANMTATPEMMNEYAAIIGGAPGIAMADATVAGMNAGGAQQDAVFGNLMNLLSRQEDRNMQSRAREAMQARQGVGQSIDAQAAGMRGGIEMANLQDARDYQRYLENIAFQENRYGQEWNRANLDYLDQIAMMNSQMGQQWARDDALRLADIAREELRYAQDRAFQEALANWQAQQQAGMTNTGIQNDFLGTLLGLIPSLTGGNVADLLNSIGA